MQVHDTTVKVVRGSVTRQEVDAIVNAANEAMRGGGGIDAAIHEEAGPGLLTELKRVAPNGAWTGAAVITGSHAMSSRGIKHIIHVAGPDARLKRHGDEQLLACSYRSSLEVAHLNDLGSVAFCSLSTGIFDYPLAKAAPLALKTVVEYLEAHPQTSLRHVVFAMYKRDEFDAFTQAMWETE